MSDQLRKLMDVRGRTALVTGAAGWLGRILCETLIEMGADVIAVDHPSAQMTSLEVFGGRIDPLLCDLEQQSDRDRLIEVVRRRGKLDVLVNNAAFVGSSEIEGWAKPFEQQTVEAWRRALEVNLTAAFDICKQLTPLLRASGRGSIINIGSIYGVQGPDWSLYQDTHMANPAGYAASKGGLLQLTRWLATTLGPDIRVNSISPGGIARGQPASFVSRYESRTPLRRMATEDDFRGALAYFASDMSSYVTGQNLLVDGGWSAW